MSADFAALRYSIVCAAMAAGLVLPAALAGAAERVTSESIINALTPKPNKPLTRSLAGPSAAETSRDTATSKFIDSLRNRPTRSLSSSEREQIAEIAAVKPHIDLEIHFDFNSANISRSSLGDMAALGKALSDPKLKGSSFVLAGHTDGVGGESVNQDLSERRADAVKKYLMDNYGVQAENLVTAGYGKSRLKNKTNPDSAENRRVEIVNVADK